MAAERPLVVSLLPAVLALLVLLILLLCVRIWISSRMVSAVRDIADRSRALPHGPLPGPVPRWREMVMPPPLPGQVRTVERRTWVVIQTSPANVETFVYANGGAMLGRAPLRTAALPPGYHRLLFWAPSIRGRSVRSVYVRPDATTWVTADVLPAPHF
jgi:hypothetical protein